MTNVRDILENLTFEVIKWNYGASSAECVAERAKAEAQLNHHYYRKFMEIVGEDVKDNGATVVRNQDGSVHSSSAGSFGEYCKNELRAELRQQAKLKLLGGEDE